MKIPLSVAPYFVTCRASWRVADFVEYSYHLMFFVPVTYVINEGQKGLCILWGDTWRLLVCLYEASHRFIFRASLLYKYAHALLKFTFFNFTNNFTQRSRSSLIRPSLAIHPHASLLCWAHLLPLSFQGNIFFFLLILISIVSFWLLI